MPQNLKILYLSQNKFRKFPDEILRLQNLEWLDFNENQLTTLPEEIGSLSNLKGLYLQGSNFFSEKEKEKIQKLLPKCEIHFESVSKPSKNSGILSRFLHKFFN
ncbi:leucine rich repeat protein [Leptospira interrogans serovar Valbuzzi str. Duyster]|nr:leucine rich repeat protein [Leptospira interrogans serovar Valbuzzi str. Duyster]ENO70974.1 leucine rich repeat protein [Leptospira interrogans serovar Valbuzzi str. Valbuzzi]